MRNTDGVATRLTGEGHGEETGDVTDDTELRDGDRSRRAMSFPFPAPLRGCTSGSSADNRRVSCHTGKEGDKRTVIQNVTKAHYLLALCSDDIFEFEYVALEL